MSSVAGGRIDDKSPSRALPPGYPTGTSDRPQLKQAHQLCPELLTPGQAGLQMRQLAAAGPWAILLNACAVLSTELNL